MVMYSRAQRAIRSTIILATAALAAAVEIEPARLATADASPLAPGAVEFALRGTASHADESLDDAGRTVDRGGRLREQGLVLGVTFGLVEGLDAGLSVGWAGIRDPDADPAGGSGPTDPGISAKWRFWSGDSGDSAFALALIPGLTAPLGRGDDPEREIPVASRVWTAGVVLAGSGSVGRLALNADAGITQAYGSADDRQGYRGGITANTAVAMRVADWIQPEIDLSWAADRVDEGKAPWSLAVTAGAQIPMPFGRLGLGVQRVIDGAEVEVATTGIIDLVIGFD